MGKRVAQLSKPLVNRIVGHGEERVDQLLANPLNFRLHPDNQQQALAGSMDDIGFIRSVTVNKRTGRVVDGHLRVVIALRSGVETLPVEYVDLDEAEEAQALISLDPIAAMAASDKAKLDELMHAVQSDDERVQQMIADLAEREGIEYGEPKPEDPGAQIDKAEELRVKWGVELGQLWKLGEHRLICGDCTDRAVVERVMGENKFRCVWTDPPYGVGYADKNDFLNALGKGNSVQEKIENDHLTEDETRILSENALSMALVFAESGASLYVACPAGTPLPHFIQAINNSGFTFKHSLVWVKNNFVLGRTDYHYKHEMILYGWIENGAHYFIDDHTKCSVFEVNKPANSDFHPTMKPIELVESMLANSTQKGDVVYEPFSGGGTTLIACERLGRKCRAIEISPAYVAVAIQRWADMTGQEPELLTS